MKRSGFTMIELIFVIVILGILAAVAIPKLAATRDDAQISKLASNIKTMIAELSAYTVSQGAAPLDDTNLSNSSNTLVEGRTSGYFTVVASGTALTNAGMSGTGRTIQVFDKATGQANRTQCGTLEINATVIDYEQESNATTICAGINSMNADANISIAGQGVRY